MECSAICYASAQLMSLGSDKEKEICRLCADICEAVATSVENTPHSIVKNVAKHVRNVLRKVGTYNYLMVWQDVCKPFFGRDLKGAIFSKLKKPSDEN